MAKNIDLTVEEKCVLRDILDTIVGDDDMRRGFRRYCNTNVPQMRKIMGKLNAQVLEASAPKDFVVSPVGEKKMAEKFAKLQQLIYSKP